MEPVSQALGPPGKPAPGRPHVDAEPCSAEQAVNAFIHRRCIEGILFLPAFGLPATLGEYEKLLWYGQQMLFLMSETGISTL